MIFKTESNFHGIFRLTSKFLPHCLAASKMGAEGNQSPSGSCTIKRLHIHFKCSGTFIHSQRYSRRISLSCCLLILVGVLNFDNVSIFCFSLNIYLFVLFSMTQNDCRTYYLSVTSKVTRFVFTRGKKFTRLLRFCSPLQLPRHLIHRF